MKRKATTEKKLKQAGERALSGGNLVAEPKTEEVPQEYAAFRNLLRQVVKPEQKPVPAKR